MKMTLRDRPPQIPAGRLSAANDWCSRHFGVHADVRKALDADEQGELVALWDRARTEYGGLDRTKLDKREHERLEALTAKAAGLDADFFQRQREQETAARKIASLARKALKPRAPTADEEISLLVELADHTWSGASPSTSTARP